MNLQGVERIADSLGYLVLTEEGAVLSSGGDLENDEVTADRMMNMLKSALKINYEDEKTPHQFKRLSVMWDNFMYAMTISNNKVFISKRRYVPQEPLQV